MISISHIPRHYRNSVAMATTVKPHNSFVLYYIEVTFGKEVSQDDRYQPHTSLLW